MRRRERKSASERRTRRGARAQRAGLTLGEYSRGTREPVALEPRSTAGSCGRGLAESPQSQDNQPRQMLRGGVRLPVATMRQLTRIRCVRALGGPLALALALARPLSTCLSAKRVGVQMQSDGPGSECSSRRTGSSACSTLEVALRRGQVARATFRTRLDNPLSLSLSLWFVRAFMLAEPSTRHASTTRRSGSSENTSLGIDCSFIPRLLGASHRLAAEWKC